MILPSFLLICADALDVDNEPLRGMFTLSDNSLFILLFGADKERIFITCEEGVNSFLSVIICLYNISIYVLYISMLTYPYEFKAYAVISNSCSSSLSIIGTIDLIGVIE